MALFYQYFANGLFGVFAGICGFVFSVFLLFPIFTLHALGAGDIKLMAVASCFFFSFQLRIILIFIAVSMFAGALQSLLLWSIKRRFPKTIHFSIPITISAILHMGGFY